MLCYVMLRDGEQRAGFLLFQANLDYHFWTMAPYVILLFISTSCVI